MGVAAVVAAGAAPRGADTGSGVSLEVTSAANSLMSDSKSSSGVATVRRERTARVAGLTGAEAELSLGGVPMIVSIRVAFDARAETSAPVSLAMA